MHQALVFHCRRLKQLCRRLSSPSMKRHYYLQKSYPSQRALGTIVSNKHRLFSYYSHCIPKPIHIKNQNYGKITNDFGYAGEDAFFTYKLNRKKLLNSTDDALSPLFFIGVADGVGSWKPKKAKDAAHYAQQLMLSGIQFLSNASKHDIHENKNNKNNHNHNHTANTNGHRNGNTTHHDTDTDTDNEDNALSLNLPQKIAEYSANYVNRVMHFDGASTLCILNIREYDTDGFKCQLNAFNLGDSGFCVYRHINKPELDESTDPCYEVLYKSQVQEQGFGIPYQLGSHPTANTIDDGYCLQQLNLKSLDIIVVGSDGLWDNLWNDEVSQIICSTMTMYHNQWRSGGYRNTKNGSNADRDDNKRFTHFNDYVHNQVVNGDLTHRIIKQAYLNSIDKKKLTPWSQAMTETVDMVYNGGKPDDITAVVVFIH